jgi:aminoglycoside phosphotransferase (APT) family kinase protein
MHGLFRRIKTFLDTPQLRNRVRLIYAKRLGSGHVRIREASSGHECRVFFVEDDGCETVIKIPNDGKAGQPLREFSASKAWQSVNVPVPNPILLDTSGSTAPFSYIIETKVDGAELKVEGLSSAEVRGILRKVGMLLRNMHSIKTKGFGFLSGDLIGSDASWGFVERRFAEELRFLFSQRVLPKNMNKNKVQRFLEARTPPQCLEPRLLHNDLHASNVMVLGSELSGIIDLGDAMSGDPEYDLARAYEGFHKDYGWVVADALLEGYGRFDKERFDYYLLFHACWTLRWFMGRKEARYAESSKQLIAEVVSSF